MSNTRSNRPEPIAAALSGFGPAGTAATIAILLAGNILGPVLAILWALATQVPLQSLGLKRPTRPLATVTAGLAAGVILKLAMKAVVMPLFGFAATNAAYHFLVGNRAALPGILITVIAAGGFGEELVWRGFLFARLQKLLDRRRFVPATMLLVSSVAFGLAHLYDQGVPGATQAFMTGAVFGGFYLAVGHLWLSVAAHAAFDVTAVLLIYLDLENSVGHAIFK